MEVEQSSALSNLLKKLINLSSNKYSRTIKATSDVSDFRIHFPISINLEQDLNYELGLMWFSSYNSIYNITNENNNFVYSKDGGKTFQQFKINPGAYEIKEIESELKKNLGDLITIQPQLSTGKVVINLAENVIIDFTKENNLSELLGFEKKIYKDDDRRHGQGPADGLKSSTHSVSDQRSSLTFSSTSIVSLKESSKIQVLENLAKIHDGQKSSGSSIHVSENLAKITNILDINIECDLVNGNYSAMPHDQGSYSAGELDNILYSFPANTVPLGYKFIERMNPPNYLPITRKTINDVHIRIIDQDGNLINFNGEKINLYLHLKQV